MSGLATNRVTWNEPITFTIPLKLAVITIPPQPLDSLRLHLFGVPATFVTIPLSQPATIEVSIKSITWTVTPSWDTSKHYTVTGSRLSSNSISWFGGKLFPPASVLLIAAQRLVSITGVATLSFPPIPDFPNLPDGNVNLMGSIGMADPGVACIGWSFTFEVIAGSSQLRWTCCPGVGWPTPPAQ